MLIDGCLSRLLAGGRPGVMKGFLALLTALDLTEDERAAHTLAWVRMLPDAHPLVAARAQVILAGLDDAGRLETEHLVEASEAALFRPEKKLVRAQLSMLDKAMKRQRSRTDELLRVAAEAFGHEEHSLQERALALVVRHRKHASGTALAGLAASAGRSARRARHRAGAAALPPPSRAGPDRRLFGVRGPPRAVPLPARRPRSRREPLPVLGRPAVFSARLHRPAPAPGGRRGRHAAVLRGPGRVRRTRRGHTRTARAGRVGRPGRARGTSPVGVRPRSAARGGAVVRRGRAARTGRRRSARRGPARPGHRRADRAAPAQAPAHRGGGCGKWCRPVRTPRCGRCSPPPFLPC
ncbi:hypothetical protein ACWV95_00815 [Streptomyces albus]